MYIYMYTHIHIDMKICTYCKKNLSSLRKTVYQEKFTIAESYYLCTDILSNFLLYKYTLLTELTVQSTSCRCYTKNEHIKPIGLSLCEDPCQYFLTPFSLSVYAVNMQSSAIFFSFHFINESKHCFRKDVVAALFKRNNILHRQSPTAVARTQTLPTKSEMQSSLACIAQAEKFGIYSVESGKSLEDWDSMSKAIFLEDKFIF